MTTNVIVVNQKGGVGKTTFADERAWGLERRGVEVGFGNLDRQGGACHEVGMVEGEGAVNIIDTPGYLGDGVEEWAANADVAIVPVQPGTLGLKPMKRTLRVIMQANPELSVGVIVNNFSDRRVIDKQFLELLKADELPVIGTVPTATAFAQGSALGRSVTEINPNGAAAKAVEGIVDQLMEVIFDGK